MSALGHKRTFAVQNVMSALLPKADMCDTGHDVTNWPEYRFSMVSNVDPRKCIEGG